MHECTCCHDCRENRTLNLVEHLAQSPSVCTATHYVTAEAIVAMQHQTAQVGVGGHGHEHAWFTFVPIVLVFGGLSSPILRTHHKPCSDTPMHADVL